MFYSLWSWNMRWAFTRSSETVKQPVLFYALVWFSRARGPHTLTGRGKSPFHPLRSRCFVSERVLDLRKNTGWFTVEKVPFPWSTIYPANFGHLELVPSSICPFLVLPSIRRYRIEYLALYAVLLSYKRLVPHTQLAIKCFTQMTKTLKTFFSSTIRLQGSLLEKSRASGQGPGGWGYSEGGQIKTNFSLCFFFCVCEVFVAAWNNSAGCAGILFCCCCCCWYNVSQVFFIFYINYYRRPKLTLPGKGVM